MLIMKYFRCILSLFRKQAHEIPLPIVFGYGSQDSDRIAYRNAVGGNILSNDTAAADHCAIADAYAGINHGIAAPSLPV